MELGIGFLLALAAGGVLTGFLAGLLGIGGGGILVPILYELYGLLGFDDSYRTHMSVATALAVIIPTGFRSAMAHNAKGSVDWDFVKSITILVLLGVLIGTLIAKVADGSLLRGVFGVITILNGSYIIWSGNHPNRRFSWRGDLTNKLYGLVVGIVSTLMGIGGGALISSYMTMFGRVIHQAVGTGAAFGPVIALPATIGYIWSGWSLTDLPPGSLGYVNWLTAAVVLPLSMLVAPLGVKAAHSLSRRKLEIAMAIFLISIGIRFIISVL